MNSYQMVEILSKITYKPGYILKSYINDGLVTFNVRIETQDADAPTEKIILNFSSVFNPIDYFSAAQLVEYVQSMIQQFELHEMNEWLKYDGALVTEPHPEKAYEPKRISR